MPDYDGKLVEVSGVKCSICHWQGHIWQLIFVLVPIPTTAGWDECHEPCCPACHGTDLIYEEVQP